MPDDPRQIGDGGAFERQLSSVGHPSRLRGPVTGSEVVPVDGDRVPQDAIGHGMTRLRIPGRLSGTIRRRVHALYAECPWLQQSNMDLVLAYVWRADRILKKTEILDKLPTIRIDKAGDGAERALEEPLRADVKLLLAMEAALCISPQARASLGIDVGRLRRMADVAPDRLPEADVTALEARIVKRIQDGVAT